MKLKLHRNRRAVGPHRGGQAVPLAADQPYGDGRGGRGREGRRGVDLDTRARSKAKRKYD